MSDFSHSLSPEPTAVGAVSSAIAVHITGRRWLIDGRFQFFRINFEKLAHQLTGLELTWTL